MSGSVGTMRASSHRHSTTKDKMAKHEKHTQQQQSTGKTELQPSKHQPTQEQLRMAQMMSSNQTDADPNTVQELMSLTGKSEEDCVIALHDAQNDADQAVFILLEGGGEQQGEWKEQSGKRKKKSNTSALKESNHNGNDFGRDFESRPKDRGDRDDSGPMRGEVPPRRGGRRNGGPPPRLARGRGRERGNFGDRDNRDRSGFGDRESRDRSGFGDRENRSGFGDRENRGGFGDRENRGGFGDRENRGGFGDRDNRDSFGDRESRETEDWDNESRDQDRRERGGAERGRGRGRGGFGGRGSSRGTGVRRGGFGSSADKDGNRSFNRVPRFEKMNNSQSMDGPEIDTWTNETAEDKVKNKDTDWNNWSDTWVNEEDQWTGTLEETKVFTPSTIKMSDPEPSISEPQTSRGQRLDVGSLFIESAKFSKAPDYSKPSGDSYITQFNQAATESIKNSIGIGSSPRGPLGISQSPATDSLGLSALGENPSAAGVGMLSSLPQADSQSSLAQMSQISQSASQAMSQIGGMSAQQSLPAQSRVPSVKQQQQQQQQQNLGVSANMGNNLQQRQKTMRSKLPPPSKIPALAVEMPGHLSRNTQLDLQFGIDFGSESTTSFGFGVDSDTSAVTGTYAATSNGQSSVIPNHLSQSHPVSSAVAADSSNSMVSGLMSSPSAGSNNVPSPIDLQQNSRSTSVFHNSVYTASPPKNDSQSIERDQKKISGPDSMAFPSSQLDRKSPMMSQRTMAPNQNLSSGSLPQPKNDGTSNYPSSNGYSSSFQGLQKSSGMSHGQASFNHSSSSGQSSGFPSQYPSNQAGFPSGGQFGGSNQFPPPPGQPTQYNSSQGQFPGQNQFSGSSSHAQIPHGNHQSQFSAGPQGGFSSSASQNQYSGYQPSAGSSFPPHAAPTNYQSNQSGQNNYQSSTQSRESSSYQSSNQSRESNSYPSSNQSRESSSYPANQSSGPNGYPSSNQSREANSYQSANQSSAQSNSLYSATSQTGSGTASFSGQSNSYQSPPSGSYNSRESQSSSTAASNTHSNAGVNFPTPPQGLSMKPSTSQTNTNFNQSFSAAAAPLQPSSLANKLGESLSKMTLKDTATLDGHQSSQFDHSSTATTSVSTTLSLPSTTSAASLSSGTSTISSTSTATSITSSSRITSMPSTSKAPPNLPPGVPLMGQYIMSQNSMPPFYSVPPVYGYEDMQLLQQRMPLQTGSYYDMSAFPAPPGSTLPTGRDQQPPLPNAPFSAGTSADSSKVPRVDAQSPNSSTQPQNAHSAAGPLINYHYGYYFPSMFPGTAGLQYPMFPMPPVTNTPAHAGTTATTQFQKNYASHVYTNKGYDELNQAQDFSKTGYGSSPNTGKPSGSRMSTRSVSSDMSQNAYNKPHSQPFDKQGFHGGTPPPYNLPMGNANQSGPMGPPTNPYGAPYMPVMAAHQAHSQMMHHPMQQDSSSSNSRGLNPAASQSKAGAGKSYGGAPYWNN